ncbi:MAG: sugar phosphate isomerase/epimerase, partial [Rhodobacterales bacterium]|nr:sugar phosphate isomerase/epimerase [Rhodobacterales bacterium]
MLCISSNTVKGNFEEKLKLISESNFNFVEICSFDILQFQNKTEEILGIIAGANLRIAAFNFQNKVYSKKDILVAAKFSISINSPILILNISDPKQIVIPDLDLIGDLKIALLPTRECEFATIQYIHKINHPNLGVALNSANVLGDGSRPARLRDLKISKLFYIQLADGVNGHLLPKLGELNLEAFIKILSRFGYDGTWCISLKEKNCPSTASAYRSLLNILNDVSISESSAKFDIPLIPSRVRATGIEFIEFAVD